MKKTDYEIIIIGYGPVGATAANLLGKRGIRALVIDRETTVFPYPRAVHFDGEVMRVFQSIGLSDKLSEIVEGIEGIQFLTTKHQEFLYLAPPPESAEKGFSATNMFYQPDLEAILREGVARFDTIDLRLGYSFEILDQNAQQVSVSVKKIGSGDMLQFSTRYLLACDGAASTVRKSLNIQLKSFNFDRKWLVADLSLKKGIRFPRHIVHICNPARPYSFIPVTGQHYRWEIMMLPGEDSADMEKPGKLDELLLSWVKSGDIQRVIRYSVYSFHSLIAQSWQRGRVILAGDAAHQMPPFAGQGMCAGIRDVQNIVWKLSLVLSQKATVALLSTYQTERYSHVVKFMKGTITIAKIVQTRSIFLAALRNFIGKICKIFPVLRPKIEKDLNYPLGKGFFPEKSDGYQASLHRKLFIQPEVTTVSGKCMLLDELLGDGFAIIGFENEPSSFFDQNDLLFWESLPSKLIKVLSPGMNRKKTTQYEKIDTVIDKEGKMTAWFTKNNCNFLILRPDKYILFAFCYKDSNSMIMSRLTQEIKAKFFTDL